VYLEHYGLRRKPFSKTPDPEFLFPSRQHAEALARLSHALEEREVAVLTGEVGAGKTTLSRALVDAFAERCRFSFVVHPGLPPAQLLGAVAGGFGLRPGRRKADAFAALAEFDELRMLTNLAADDRALVGLVLLGQPELRERLRDKGGEAFAQRVGVAYHVGALDLEETGRYLSHRLAVAGRDAPLFDGPAVAAVHRISQGLPRRVNQVAASALLEGFARDDGTISAEVVEAAASDLATHMGTPAPAR
jgi:general secretion pathway protein A